MKRVYIILWLSIISIYLVVSGGFAYQAPCGAWQNTAFGAYFWGSWDPGGAYLGSALHFFGPEEYPPFYGHPGLTLQLVLYALAKIGHTLHLVSGGAAPYEEFAAKNIRMLSFMAKMVATGLHLISFYVLYRFSLKLLGSSRASFLAVLTYATTFPVLYYLDRPSPEPLLVTFFLLTVLWIWTFQESMSERKYSRAYLFIALASLAAVAAFYTKMHLVGPLLPFAFFQVLFQKYDPDESLGRRVKNRVLPACLFVLCSASFLYLGGLKMNWEVFIREWSVGMDAEVQRTWSSPLQGYLRPFLRTYLTPTSEGVLTVTEGLFFLGAVIGLVWYWRMHREGRSRVSWLILYALLLMPIVLYRRQWHYLFIHLALAAVFFAYFLCESIDRLTRDNVTEQGRFRLAALAVLLVHFTAILFYLDSKRADMVAYRAIMPYHQALDSIRYGERVAVVAREGKLGPTHLLVQSFGAQAIAPAGVPVGSLAQFLSALGVMESNAFTLGRPVFHDLWWLHGVSPEYVSPDTPFQRAFCNLFVIVPPGQELSPREMAERNIGVVVDLSPSGVSVRPVSGR